MTKPLHPTGTHLMRLVIVNKSKYGPLGAQCIFEGTGENKHCFTISRFISSYGRWADSSNTLLLQLTGFNSDNNLVTELQKYVGLEFVCVIPRMGKSGQMNIARFIEPSSNINGSSPSVDVTIPGKLNELG